MNSVNQRTLKLFQVCHLSSKNCKKRKKDKTRKFKRKDILGLPSLKKSFKQCKIQSAKWSKLNRTRSFSTKKQSLNLLRKRMTAKIQSAPTWSATSAIQINSTACARCKIGLQLSLILITQPVSSMMKCWASNPSSTWDLVNSRKRWNNTIYKLNKSSIASLRKNEEKKHLKTPLKNHPFWKTLFKKILFRQVWAALEAYLTTQTSLKISKSIELHRWAILKTMFTIW